MLSMRVINHDLDASDMILIQGVESRRENEEEEEKSDMQLQQRNSTRIIVPDRRTVMQHSLNSVGWIFSYCYSNCWLSVYLNGLVTPISEVMAFLSLCQLSLDVMS